MDYFLAFIAGLGLGLYGWAIVICAFAACFWLSSQRLGWVFFAPFLVAVGAALWYIAGVNILAGIQGPWWMVGIYIIGYFLIGIAWSGLKWYWQGRKATRALHKAFKQFRDECNRYLADKGRPQKVQSAMRFQNSEQYRNDLAKLIDEMTDVQVTILKDQLLQDRVPESVEKHWRPEEQPEAKQYAGKLVNWLVYWPWSMLNYFLWNFLQDIGRMIWRRLTGFYNAIMAFAYRGVDPSLLRKTKTD